METGSLTICLYALFVFSAEGTQLFTGEPKNPFLAVEGDNVTLEWRYSFGKDDSLSQALFEKEKQIVDRYSPSRPPWIKSSYRGRILVNITNDYTLIILLEVKRTDEGNYKFTVVSEKDRERFEKEVEISILYLDQPKINSTDTRPVEGTRVYLSCFADGKPTPTISWTVNGSPLNTSRNSRVSLRNENKQLTIMNLDRTDSGEYQCVAHSSLRNVSSNSSTLSVQYPPAIALIPLNATKEKGVNFTWFCNASGNPEPNISWMFNGSHINTHYNPKIVFSKDKGKMTITNVGRTDSGEYQCMASNNIGNASSQLATFDVLYIPGITAHPDNVTEKEGENATLLCNAVGNPVPKISWNKGGSPLSNNSRVNLSADNKHLTITNVKRVDSGEYRCVATNSLGYVTSYPAYLGVQYKPEISPLPRVIQRMEGEKLTIFCNASGNPLPTISWTKDGNSVDTNNSSRRNLSCEGKQLTVKNVSRGDNGVYRCVAENSLGNVMSHGTTLEVPYIPGITMIGGPQQFAIVGKIKKLLCEYDAMPPVSEAQWIKDGDVIARNSSLLVNESRISVPYYNESQIQLLINQSTSQDAGNYSCLVINAVGNSSQRTSVISQELPLITTRPEGKTLREGEKITLSCNATGNPEPSISWVKDGSPINSKSRISLSKDNKRLTITNISRTDSGEYQCVARNRVGNDTSNSKVDVLYKPEIATHPRNIITREGQNVTLYCNATGNPAPTISWYKNGYPINNSFSTILSPSHEQLTIRNVNRIDRGDYTCRAKNRAGADTSNASTINVQFLAEIVSHPQANVTKEEGSNLTLFCNATGNPAPMILWTKDGAPINNYRIRFSIHNRQLIISNVKRTDSGHYRCVANNSLGNNTSNVAAVDIQCKPEITTHPKSENTKEGGNVTFSCNSTANPLPTTSWTKDESAITNDSRISFSVVNKVLTITNVNRNDSGEYRCVASNKLGNDTSKAAGLNVKYKSEITTHPSNVTKTEGENVTLHCNATGYPLPTLSWTKDGSDISNALRISFSADKKQLAITKASQVDSGVYRCVASNSLGNDTSIAAVVDVQSQPEISIHPRNVTIARGDNVTFRCSVVGNPTPSVVWTKDKDLDVTANSRVTLSSRNDHHSLEIARVYLSDSGQYRCVANNSQGRSSSSAATLTVQYVPDPPTDVKVISRGSRKLNISWTAGFNRNSAIQNYTVEISEDRQTFRYAICQGTLLVNGCVIYATRVSIKELFPWTTYYLRVFARNMIGSSNYSSVVNVTTDEEVPSSAPPLNVTVLSSTAVNVSWQMLTKQDARGAILGYYILYKRKSVPEASWKNRTVDRADTTSLLLVSLDEYTSYEFAIQAFNRKGVSGQSEIVERETDEGEPSRGAENVSSSEVNYTTNRITWAELPKEAANGVIKLYEVRLELKESCLRVDFTFYAMNTTKTSVLLTGFWMCAKYEVSVRGYTVAGPGPFGKAIVVQTKSLKLSQKWSKETPSPPSFSQILSGEGITANITLPRFPGNAKFFQVIVIRYSLDYTGVVNSPESFTPKDLMTYEEAHKSLVPAAYITFQFRGQDFDAFREFVVGDGENSSSKTRNRRSSDGEVFLNKPLQPNTNYRVFLRAFIEKMVYFSSNFVTIETRGEPAVKDLPERTIFQVGDVVVLTCEATGDPKPSVAWSKDGNTSIPRAQFRNDEHILVIQEVAPSDGGIYECRASNIFGQRRTATAVIIAVPPSIMKDVSPRSVLCAKETSCSLLCHATSDIPFNYSWTRNGQALDGHNIKVMNNSVIITPLDDQDFGDYVCHATNSFGSTTYKITLSESREEGNNVQSIFQANDIIWSGIVFLLLVLIGVLIWRLRRAQANNRPATAKKATIKDTVQSVFPLEQHASEPASYMELRPRPSEGQTRVPPEYQSLQGSHVNAGYYNVVPEEGNKRRSNEEIYEEIELSDC